MPQTIGGGRGRTLCGEEEAPSAWYEENNDFRHTHTHTHCSTQQPDLSCQTFNLDISIAGDRELH